MGLFDRPIPATSVAEDKHVAFPEDPEYKVEYKYSPRNSATYPHQYEYTITEAGSGKAIASGHEFAETKKSAFRNVQVAAQSAMDDYASGLTVPDTTVMPITPTKRRS